MDKVSVIIETPAGSGQKYTFDPVNGRIKVNKVLPLGMAFPYDFGYLPGTLGQDGDPLDVMVISEYATFPGCEVECRLIGALTVSQSVSQNSNRRIRNDRFLAVPLTSIAYKEVRTIGDLPREIMEQLEQFFINYIEQEGKRLQVNKRTGAAQAKKLIERSEVPLPHSLLFEIFLPLRDNSGNAFPKRHFEKLRNLLVKKFGGVTLYHRTPVRGVWDGPQSGVDRDDMIIYEVMASCGEEVFWRGLKEDLKKAFRQQELLIRSTTVNVL